MAPSLRLALLASLAAHGAAAWVLPGAPAANPALPVLLAELRTVAPTVAARPAVPHPPPPTAERPQPASPRPTRVPQPRAPAAHPLAVLQPSPVAPAQPAGQAPAAEVALAPSVVPAGATKSAVPPLELPRYDAAYLANPPPVYPALARRRGIEGKVILEAHINTAGIPFAVKVVTSAGDASLDEAALNAVWHWRFIAAKRGDQAVEAWVRIPLVFRLD